VRDVFEILPLSRNGEMRGEDARTLVFGHTHNPSIHAYSGVQLLNCGSVSQPKDADAGRRSRCSSPTATAWRPGWSGSATTPRRAVAREVAASVLPTACAEKLVAA
jgi:Calcineurin-like phosphoesterase superfamily domain